MITKIFTKRSCEKYHAPSFIFQVLLLSDLFVKINFLNLLIIFCLTDWSIGSTSRFTQHNQNYKRTPLYIVYNLIPMQVTSQHLCAAPRFSLFAIHTFSRVFCISAASIRYEIIGQILGSSLQILWEMSAEYFCLRPLFFNNNSLLVVPVSLILGVS